MRDFKLTQIWIYPIKSLGGISLASAQVMSKGLQYDRRWMLIDDTSTAMTQRVYPKMALFKPTVLDSEVKVKYGQYELSIALGSASFSSPLHVRIWQDRVIAYEVGSGHSQWFSDMLGVECKLVFFPEQNARQVDPQHSVNGEHVSLADAYPFLIIGQSSLDDLNLKLDEPIPITRFRPNFVFEGGKPYEEDTWKFFSIGETRFAGVKLCSRCVVPTVNQLTGEKGVEPLKTLGTYRKWDNKIYFGQNLVALDNKIVNVGDRIILEQNS